MTQLTLHKLHSISSWLVWANIECTVNVALPKQPINQFSKADNRDYEAHCSNIYTLAPGQKFQPGNQKVDVHADMIALTLPKMTRNIHAFQYSDFSQNSFTDMESRPKSELRRQQIDLFIQVSNLERSQSHYAQSIRQP